MGESNNHNNNNNENDIKKDNIEDNNIIDNDSKNNEGSDNEDLESDNEELDNEDSDNEGSDNEESDNENNLLPLILGSNFINILNNNTQLININELYNKDLNDNIKEEHQVFGRHLPLIVYGKLNSLTDDKRDLLLDLNFHFKKLDKIIDCINNLTQEAELKQKEANSLIKEIETNVNKLTGEDIIHLIEEDITTLDDLIYVAKKYGNKDPIKKFSVDVKILYKIIDPLEKLKNTIGMNEIKDQLVDQILTSLQGLYDEDLMFHTVIKGPPGVGKTMLAKIIGEIYNHMGVLKNNSDKLNFVIAKRSDLVGKYLGHTAVKTQNLIDKCDGGVLFIDEVYSLGNNEKKDSFAKECIDTINLNLTEKKNFICIIAGYPEEIENCFFSYNPGLKRRFPFSYEITGYSAIELTNILTSKIHLSNWELVNDIDIKVLEQFIEKNKDTFNHFGGDIDTLLLNIKIVHGRRIFGKDPTLKKKITLDDIKKGYDKMMLSKTKNDDNEIKYSHMYS